MFWIHSREMCPIVADNRFRETKTSEYFLDKTYPNSRSESSTFEYLRLFGVAVHNY